MNSNEPTAQPRILRRRNVEARTGLSRSTIYDRIAKGTFPRPIQLGNSRIVGWDEREVLRWIEARLAEGRKATP